MLMTSGTVPPVLFFDKAAIKMRYHRRMPRQQANESMSARYFAGHEARSFRKSTTTSFASASMLDSIIGSFTNWSMSIPAS